MSNLRSGVWVAAKRALRAPWLLLRRAANFIDSDYLGGQRPPAGNYIPNSSGEGGTVISSGQPGGH